MKFLFLGLVFATLSSSALANDEALYDPAISDDLVYIRILNHTEVETKPALNGKKYPNLKVGQLSPYYPHNISTIKIESDFSKNVEKGSFYTLILDKPIWLVKDFQATDRRKAVLAFYNLSDQDGLSLKANKDIKIFENLGNKSHQARFINEAKIDLFVEENNEIKAKLEDIIIERRNHYSVIYDGQSLHVEKASIYHNS
jgi:alginate O-acetyltransferase complex protein AlgF